MSGFNQIKSFGVLTVNGRKLTFEDFDKNKNGEISISEYNSLLKDVELDTIEFSSIDCNSNKIITKDEFSIWEQKVLMQNAVNSLASQISRDFSGKPQCLEDITKQLKSLINDYAATFYGDISNLAVEFKKDLPEKYKLIKQTLLANDPSAISAEVVFNIAQNLKAQYTQKDIPDTFLSRIISELNKETTRFLKKYNKQNLRYDLQTHLEEYLKTSEASTIQKDVASFQENIIRLDLNDFNGIKEEVKTILQTAIEKGIILNLGGCKILTDVAITNVLKKFETAEELLSAITTALLELNTKPRLEVILAEEQTKATIAIEEAFININSSEYQIDISKIDYSKLDPRYYNNGKIYQKSKKTAKEDAYNEGFSLLTDEKLKSQLRTQIQAVLQAKGVPFERIANVFENVYNQTAEEALKQAGMITGRHKTWFRKATGEINVKTMYDTFLTKFNKNIIKTIKNINASSKDFDTIDLDYNALDNNNVAKNGEDFSTLYASGNKITIRGEGADYYVKTANKLIDNLKEQILTKAQIMCKNNGIEFDQNTFETIFNNAKAKGIATSITGCDGNKRTVGNTAAGAALGVGVGVCTSFTIGAISGAGTFLGALGYGALTICGPIGWGLAAAGLVLGVTLGPKIFKAITKSTIDTKNLIDTFTKAFAGEYTEWVKEKSTPQIKTNIETETKPETDSKNNTNKTNDENPNKNIEERV